MLKSFSACNLSSSIRHLLKQKQMVPYFNAPIYLDKNSKIGKVDEVRYSISLSETKAPQQLKHTGDDDVACCVLAPPINRGYKSEHAAGKTD
jgi:hypothetical protein